MTLVIQMAHDSYCCQDVQFPSQPFPSPRQNRMFVGWRQVGKDGENLTDPCPEKCRPQNLTAGTFAASADWTFCWWKSVHRCIRNQFVSILLLLNEWFASDGRLSACLTVILNIALAENRSSAILAALSSFIFRHVNRQPEWLMNLETLNLPVCNGWPNTLEFQCLNRPTSYEY